MSHPKPGEEIEHLGEVFIAMKSLTNGCTGCALFKYPDDKCIRKDGNMYCNKVIWLTRNDFVIQRLTS